MPCALLPLRGTSANLCLLACQGPGSRLRSGCASLRRSQFPNSGLRIPLRPDVIVVSVGRRLLGPAQLAIVLRQLGQKGDPVIRVHPRVAPPARELDLVLASEHRLLELTSINAESTAKPLSQHRVVVHGESLEVVHPHDTETSRLEACVATRISKPFQNRARLCALRVEPFVIEQLGNGVLVRDWAECDHARPDSTFDFSTTSARPGMETNAGS
mmetsp:Transcript_111903/g.347201  ORF Transcript_111903/g.347201 Transcript_111903/m.347201 type:complete len:215 (-) Transcript_111903:57-701(-)